MVIVGAVIHRRLPIDRLDPLYGAEGFGATVQPVEGQVQVPPGVAQVGLQRRSAWVPGGEDDARICIDSGLNQAKFIFVQLLVIYFVLAGDEFQISLVGIGPPVIRAHEVLGIANICPDDPVASVPAHVQKGVEFPVGVSGENHRVFADVGMEEVVDIRDKAVMADHDPGPAENLVQFLPVDLFVAEYFGVQATSFQVYDVVFLLINDHNVLRPTVHHPGLVITI